MPSDRDVLELGIPLNKIKGTRAAVKEILKWFSYEDSSVREVERPLVHFADFEVDPGDVIEDLHLVVKIYRAMQNVIPARSRFTRIFHGFDRQVFYVGESQFGNEYLDTSSGIEYDSLGYSPEKTGLIISFGRREGFEIERERDPIDDEYHRQNFHFWDGTIEKAFPILDVDFEGRFYDPRLSVLEGFKVVHHSEVLQPVASWDSMSWGDETWSQRAILDKHTQTENPVWDDDELWDDDDSWED